MGEIDFISVLHKRTQRDYLGRVNEWPKAEATRRAGLFEEDYWDGPRRYGYGGYRYDGRWRPVADRMAEHYGLWPGMRVLDVGCGRGHLLYELGQAVPGLELVGFDVSRYGLRTAKEELAGRLIRGCASALPFPDQSFDLVLSLTTIHNLPLHQAVAALSELERVGRGGKYLVVEAYRNATEKVNLLYWQLTCECFFRPEEWAWVYQQAGYTGDWSYIYFE